MEKNNPKVLNAWCLYDWANSTHSLVIVSAIFPVYFGATAVNAQGGDVIDFLGFSVKNSALFSFAVSLAFLIVACTSPIFSAIADFSGRKKLFLRLFCYLGSLSCMMLYFFTKDTITSSTIYFTLSLVGWAGSIVFYNSFLPEIATEDRFDALSAKGYSMGYIGSVLLMIFNLTMLLKPEWYGGISNATACRISFLSVGVWWVAFAHYAFGYLPSVSFNRRPTGNWIFNGFRELRKVFSQLPNLPLLKQYLTAYFFYSMGVQTVMYVAAVFGDKELKMESSALIMTILIIQLIAIVGSYTFSWLSSRYGNIPALMVSVSIWIFICGAAYVVNSQNQFYGLAAVVGFVMGGIQALSRSTYAKLIPKGTTDTASYFSFYDVTEKVAIVLGTLLFGVIDQITNMRNSVLMLMFLFIIGLILLFRFPAKKTLGLASEQN